MGKVLNQCNGNKVFPSKFQICKKALTSTYEICLDRLLSTLNIWQILWWWYIEHGINLRGYDHRIQTWLDIILSWIKIHFVISNIAKVEGVFFLIL